MEPRRGSFSLVLAYAAALGSGAAALGSGAAALDSMATPMAALRAVAATTFDVFRRVLITNLNFSFRFWHYEPFSSLVVVLSSLAPNKQLTLAWPDLTS
jgi:hypothetical protein